MYPPPRSIVSVKTVKVRGTATDAGGIAELTVNGQPAQGSNGFETWVAVPLEPSPIRCRWLLSAGSAFARRIPMLRRCRASGLCGSGKASKSSFAGKWPADDGADGSAAFLDGQNGHSLAARARVTRYTGSPLLVVHARSEAAHWRLRI